MDTNTKEVTLGEDSDCIEESQFEGNLELVKICIARSVRIIRKNAFKGCTNLTSVWCSEDGLEKIEDSAFEDCVNLTSIVIPDTLGAKSIAPTAFQGCDKIKYVFPEFQLLIPDEFLDPHDKAKLKKA